CRVRAACPHPARRCPRLLDESAAGRGGAGVPACLEGGPAARTALLGRFRTALETIQPIRGSPAVCEAASRLRDDVLRARCQVLTAGAETVVGRRRWSGRRVAGVDAADESGLTAGLRRSEATRALDHAGAARGRRRVLTTVLLAGRLGDACRLHARV